MANLLIVDDEPGMRQLLSHVFGRGAGHAVRTAENGAKALELLRGEPADLIISDVKMPDMNGIELLRRVREFLPDAGVVLMTAFATVETAREAFKLGADDFIQKPFDVEEMKLIVEKALERLRLLQENRAFKRAQRERGRLDQIIGHSQKMQAVYQMIETVAQVQSTVLITGESGTGKEMVARAIHNLSPRSDKPFMPINCGAFTETLLESELFGYVRGAFTGATANRKGLVEAADKGPIFPDDIGETSATTQGKVALERADSIQPESLQQSVTNYNPASVSPSAFELPEEGLNLVAHLEHLEKTYLLEALQRTGGNQTRAAEILHLSVRSLRHLLDKHGVRSLTAQLRSDAASRGASEG